MKLNALNVLFKENSILIKLPTAPRVLKRKTRQHCKKLKDGSPLELDYSRRPAMGGIYVEDSGPGHFRSDGPNVMGN